MNLSRVIPVPDLMCADAAVRVDVAALRQALVFAFAAGGAMDAFDDAINKASLPASSWARAGAIIKSTRHNVNTKSLCLVIHALQAREDGCIVFYVRIKPMRITLHRR